jgi:hypothetical protein
MEERIIFNKAMESSLTPYNIAQSLKGNYFIGHTPQLVLEHFLNAWGGLINPVSSAVTLCLNSFSVTNFSSSPFGATLYLNSKPLGKASLSEDLSCSNSIINMKPKAQLTYSQIVPEFPDDGKSLFTKLAEPFSTVNINDCFLIIPPGGSLTVFLNSPIMQLIKAEVSFNWYEFKDL